MIPSVFTDDYFMNEAYKLALEAYEVNEIPVGAVIVSQNRIIARSYNQTERLVDCTAHAEMLAITSAQHYFGNKYLNDCSIYVTLEPCPMCAGALYWSQIGKIFFGAKDQKRGFSSYKPSLIHPKTSIHQGLMEQECSDLVSAFFKKLRD